MDNFQKRYLKHQTYKKRVLTGEIKEKDFKENKTVLDVIKNRRSRRIYKTGITKRQLQQIFKIAEYSPSSCNRKGVVIKPCSNKLLNLLVGARKWHKKGTVIAFYAKKKAYKSEWEKDYMPYLDTGVIVQTIYLYCEYKKLKCCFINPNTHGKYKPNDIFCGAMAIGK